MVYIAGRGRGCRGPPWLLLSLLKGVDLLYHAYLLALLITATYLSAMMCSEHVGILTPTHRHLSLHNDVL